MPSYRLTYFDGTGRAETCRMVLAYAGVPFEDRRIDQDQWKKMKAETPWGSLPILEYDGQVIGQSKAVSRFAARQVGLAGKTPIEAAIADSTVDTISEIFDGFVPIMFASEKQKKDMIKSWNEKTLTPQVANLEKLLKNNKGGINYLVGDQVTWADLHYFNAFENILKVCPTALKSAPKLNALFSKIKDLDKIKAHVATRPVKK